MAIHNLYSKRQKELRGERIDVYVYDEIPHKLRIQLVHIIDSCFGMHKSQAGLSYIHGIYEKIHKVLCVEYGVLYLYHAKISGRDNLRLYIEKTVNYEHVLDIVEIVLQYLKRFINSRNNYQLVDINTSLNKVIEEINYRFKENGVGYVYESGQFIRIDSQIIHNEVTKPTLSLLHNPKFAGANEEYLQAHKHYMEGKNKECLNDCLKAFESTLKIICKEKGWPFDEKKDTAKKLISICLENELVPEYMQTQINSLRGALESGVPVIRNKNSGHGQGQVPQKVDDSLTRYTLNLTGTNIIFLIEQSGVK